MATDQIFVLPDLGEGLAEAEIVAWHVAEGDHAVTDQPLVSVETDKAVVEISSPWSGRIARLLASTHARVAVGAPLAAFAETIEADTGTVVGSLAAGRAEAAPATPAGGATPGPDARREREAARRGRSMWDLCPTSRLAHQPSALANRTREKPAWRDMRGFAMLGRTHEVGEFERLTAAADNAGVARG